MAGEAPTGETEDTASDATADEQPADTQDDIADEAPASETEDTSSDASADEQPADTQSDVPEDAPASENEDTAPDANADEQPAETQDDMADEVPTGESEENKQNDTEGEAQETGQCPKCGKPIDQCTCTGDEGDDTQDVGQCPKCGKPIDQCTCTDDDVPSSETENVAPDANADEQPVDTQDDLASAKNTVDANEGATDNPSNIKTEDKPSDTVSNANKESWNYDEWGPNPFADTKALARGEVADHVFNNEDVDDINRANLKLEDLSKNDYEKLKQTNPQRASQLLTDYNDRNIMPDDLSSRPRHLDIDNNNGLYVVDKDLSANKATMRDIATGKEYSVYPNPMDRVSHMAGQQGQNDLGMHQDCGIASTAKGINDIYGKNVTSENRLANYAYDTHNCSIEKKPDGTVDIYNSGGTWEGNVKDFYNANGLTADMYVKDNVPTPDYIASRLKNGDVATLAVNHDLMWNWDKAQAFNPANVDATRYATDPSYARHVNDLMKMKTGGVFQADHFVNVSNAVYDKNGALTHFIVSDTGNGTTRMIDKDYLYRAYNGGGKISVTAQGCVIAGRR